MKYQLRDYQSRVIYQDLLPWFEENGTGNPIVSACVGSGKSIMIAELCSHAVNGYSDKSRVLMLVPSKELLLQNYEKLVHVAPDLKVGVISASVGRKDTAHTNDVIVATIGSVYKNPGLLGRIDLIVIDECHLVNRKDSGMYREFIAECMRFNSHIRVIGWTGTPFRGDGVWLTEGSDRLFTDIVSRVTIDELIESGHLSRLVTADTGTQISGDGIRMSGGDYVISALAAATDKDELNSKIAFEIVTLASSRNRWLVYAVTVEHANHLSEKIAAYGIKTKVVSAKTQMAERDRTIADFRRGSIQCIVNVAVLTTGFDVPDVDCIALVRNTRSPVLYTQIAGRGMRVAKSKHDCLWLDFTDTTYAMGPVNAVKGRPEPNKSDLAGQAPFKICPECGASNAAGANKCKNEKCGYDFPPNELKATAAASRSEILSLGDQTVKKIAISGVTYSSHQKIGGKHPVMRVDYWTANRRYCAEWVCLEHFGFARVRAENWWNERQDKSRVSLGVPSNVSDALMKVKLLREPSHIVVRLTGKYPEVISCIFE